MPTPGKSADFNTKRVNFYAKVGSSGCNFCTFNFALIDQSVFTGSFQNFPNDNVWFATQKFEISKHGKSFPS